MSDWTKMETDKWTTRWQLDGTDWAVVLKTTYSDDSKRMESWYAVRRPNVEINGLTLYHHGPKERFVRLEDAKTALLDCKSRVDTVLAAWGEYLAEGGAK